jgi:diguanylate cyclase (GGDEF)-like protein
MLGGWAICAVALLDRALPPTYARDLLYLVPLGLVAWRLGRSVAWYFALNTGMIRVLATYERLVPVSPGTDPTDERAFLVNTAASVVEYGAFTWGLLALRDTLARERRRAREDALTGLLNRGAFGEALERACADARTPGRWRRAWRTRRRDGSAGCALAYVDLGGFKQVNDTLGHDAGDEVLRVAAEVLRGAVRADDIVARLGGDEFALWLPGADAETARAVSARALERLREVAAAHGWAVGASVGVAAFAAPPASRAAAVSAADALMYEVKRDGKGRVLVRAA